VTSINRPQYGGKGKKVQVLSLHPSNKYGSLKVMAQKGFIGTLISWGECINEKLTGEKSVF
jgi:hypothetical protein